MDVAMLRIGNLSVQRVRRPGSPISMVNHVARLCEGNSAIFILKESYYTYCTQL
jgi:hypothetical protein